MRSHSLIMWTQMMICIHISTFIVLVSHKLWLHQWIEFMKHLSGAILTAKILRLWRLADNGSVWNRKSIGIWNLKSVGIFDALHFQPDNVLISLDHPSLCVQFLFLCVFFCRYIQLPGKSLSSFVLSLTPSVDLTTCRSTSISFRPCVWRVSIICHQVN